MPNNAANDDDERLIAVSQRDREIKVLAECAPIAATLDAARGGEAYAHALTAAQATLAAPHSTPSARVLAELQQQHDNDFIAFALAHSQSAQDILLGQPWSESQQARYQALAERSLEEQRAIEVADDLPFEAWRERFMAVEQLG